MPATNSFDRNALIVWAEHTAKFYREIVEQKQYDFAFYTQSDLSKLNCQPTFAIVGINPGSEGTYSNQLNNPDLWSITNRKTGIDGGAFIKGNPCFDNFHNWHMYKGLKAILATIGKEDLIDSEENFVWTNAINFNTKKESQIPKPLYNKCVKCTLELFDIIHPQMILCLGKTAYNKLTELMYGSKSESIYRSSVSRIFYNNLLFVNIPHTSHYYSYEERDMVGGFIKLLLENPMMPVEDMIMANEEKISAFESRPKVPSFSKQYALDVENGVRKELSLFERAKSCRYYPMGDELYFTVSHGAQNTGDISVNFEDTKARINNPQTFEKCRCLIQEKHHFHAPESEYLSNFRLGYKTFKDYEGKESPDKVKAIVNEIKAIVEEFKSEE